jgi:atypical dual specificity phosphatase
MDTINWIIDCINEWRKYNYYITTVFSKYVSHKFLYGDWWTVIDNNVILGAIPLQNEDHLNKLKAEGVGAVICLLEDFEMKPTLYFQPVSEEDWKKENIKFMHVSVPDGGGVQLDDIIKCMNFICSNMQNNIKTYIHCKAGRGRSVSIVLCYLVLNYHINNGNASLDDMMKLYEELKIVRPEIGLNETQLAPIREYVCRISADLAV